MKLIKLSHDDSIPDKLKLNYALISMFKLTRGMIYEELAEICTAKAIIFAKLAYEDLSGDEMFIKTAPERLERLQQLQKTNI